VQPVKNARSYYAFYKSCSKYDYIKGVLIHIFEVKGRGPTHQIGHEQTSHDQGQCDTEFHVIFSILES
jgi:hypothetical protein